MMNMSMMGEAAPLPQNLSQDEDNDDHSAYDPHAALVDHVRAGGSRDGDKSSSTSALAYLLRYETMVRQQEAEDMATLAHVRPCILRLQELCGGASTSSSNGTRTAWDDALLPGNRKQQRQFLQETVSFAQLSAALQAMESSNHAEFLSTDRQLIMVLRMLTVKAAANDSNNDNTGSYSDGHITWAEFIQCYKVCILGMMTLQHLPASNPARARARDRTLSMLSLFEPYPTKLFAEETGAEGVQQQRGAGLHSSTCSRRRSNKREKVVLMLLVAAILAGFAMVVLDPGLTSPTISSSAKNLPKRGNRALVMAPPSQSKHYLAPKCSDAPTFSVTNLPLPRSLTNRATAVSEQQQRQQQQDAAAKTHSPTASIDWSHRTEHMGLATSLGGLAGIALSPTVLGVGPTVVFGLGVASLGKHVVQALGTLWRMLTGDKRQ